MILNVEERDLTWEERKDLLTPEQYSGTTDENGQYTGFGYISPFTDIVIHYWLDFHKIPRKIITTTNENEIKISYK